MQAAINPKYFTDAEDPRMLEMLDKMNDNLIDGEIVIHEKLEPFTVLSEAPDDDLVHVSDFKQLYKYIQMRDEQQSADMMELFDKYATETASKLSSMDAIKANIATILENQASLTSSITIVTRAVMDLAKSVESLNMRFGRHIADYDEDISDINETQKNIGQDIENIKRLSILRKAQIDELSDKFSKASTYQTTLCMDIMRELQHTPAFKKE